MVLLPRITKVVLRNFKSIAACRVQLSPLTILVGPNGAGKSNFLDAFRLVSEALTEGLDQAIRSRRSAEHILFHDAVGTDQGTFAIELELALPGRAAAAYSLTIGVKPPGEYEILREACRIRRRNPVVDTIFEVKRGSRLTEWQVPSTPVEIAPARSSGRLYLVNASGIPAFRPIYDALAEMAFYNPSPSQMREPQLPDSGGRLAHDAANIACVLRRMTDLAPVTKQRIEEYLGLVVDGVTQVDTIHVNRYEMLEFVQELARSGKTRRFQADQMSDGMLRALGILVALFQAAPRNEPRLSLIGLEEPESTLHPAAIGVLLDALSDASELSQVLVTSHSADLLDRPDLGVNSLLAVQMEDGVTHVGPIDRAGRLALRRRLLTAGDLLRMNHVRPEAGASSDEGPVRVAG
jgi:predicted ATPase